MASREVVAGVCGRAARAGIAVGMDLAQARSMLPPGVATDAVAGARLHLEEHRPERDAGALHAMACWMTRFAPTVAPDGVDGLLLDVSGTERLHGGEARLLRRVAGALGRMGFLARIASASTFACAWGVARFGAHDLSLVPSGREREAIGPLPVAALRLDGAMVRGLEEVGIARVEEVLRLNRAAIAARFEPALLERVDRALGRSVEVVEGVRPEPPLRAELLFDGPTDQWESVEAAARRVVEDMARLLEGVGRGVRRLEVELSRPNAEPERIGIALSRPSRSVRHLWSLVRARLERIDLGRGVEGVVLVAVRTGRLRHRQTTSAALGARVGTAGGIAGVGDERTPESVWGELVDTLVGRLGADGVVRVETVESHLPERTFRERSALEEGGRGGGARRGVALGDRPTVLLGEPEPVEVLALTPDGPVLEVGWRGERRRVVSCAGPERIASEWWRWGVAGSGQGGGRARGPAARPAPPDRDYFAVQMEGGRWVWVCRQLGTGRWFVHGVWS